MATAPPSCAEERSEAQLLSWEERRSAVLAQGVQRMHDEVHRMMNLGIVNERGNLLRQDLPPDMSPQVERDFGG